MVSDIRYQRPLWEETAWCNGLGGDCVIVIIGLRFGVTFRSFNTNEGRDSMVLRH
jgi:hypothetical protein